MTDPDRKEVRATLSGLGFDLVREQGSYVVRDRRLAVDLPTTLQPTVCETLEGVIGLFNLR